MLIMMLKRNGNTVSIKKGYQFML